MKHVGTRIIEEHRLENALLRQSLKQAGVKLPEVLSKPDSPEVEGPELTKSEEAKLKEYYAMRQ
jgi:hypothetical protein